MQTKTFFVTVFLFLHGFHCLRAEPVVEPYSSKPSGDELAFMQTWIGSLTQSGKTANASRYSPMIPFSFVCGDRSSREWIRTDNAKTETGKWTNDVRVHTLRWKDDATALNCEMRLTEYRNFPAMTWTVYLKNEGTADTALIHDFKALDTTWKRKDDSPPILYRSYGSNERVDDFRVIREEMTNSVQTVRMDWQTNTEFRRNTWGIGPHGCPSTTWMPFFNLQTGTDGLILGIGWSGLWFAEIGHDGKGTCSLAAGMERLNSKLLPGESIRSPLHLVFYWSGEYFHSQNMFRQFVLKHFTPQENGQPVRLPASCLTWGGTPTQGHLDMIQKIVECQLPYDCYWVDAGWHGDSTEVCRNGNDVVWAMAIGDWRVNLHRHPNTLKPISDAAKKAKMKFLLWFEADRATYGTPKTLESPEFFLKQSANPPQKGDWLALDMGNPDARTWITDVISNTITEYGVDWYREDHFDPSPYWNFSDVPDRTGMKELRHIEGFYAFWDELHRRHPGLQIDNCAGGARRIELETMKRSVPLWRTDYNCYATAAAEATQSHTFSIALWVPLNTVSPTLMTEDTYQCRSGLSAGVVYSLYECGMREVPGPDFDGTWWRERLLEAKRAMPYFYGDFYPLTSGDFADDNWLAYHLYLPEKESGLIVAYRRPKSDVVSMNFDLMTLKPNARYEFEDIDTGEKKILSGEEVRKNGFMVSTKQSRESRLVYYRHVD